MLHADVAELVDALVSGTSGGNIVEFKSPHPHIRIPGQDFSRLYELLAYQPINNF